MSQLDVFDAPAGINLEPWRPETSHHEAPDDDRPALSLTGTLDVQERAVLAAVQAHNDPPHLFKRGRELVRLVWVLGQPMIEAFNPASLRAHLQRRFTITRLTKLKTGDIVDEPANMPIQLAECILSNDDWPLPGLVSVIRSPVVSSAGRLVTEEGFNGDLQAYLHFAGLRLPEQLERPSEAQLDQAKRLLLDDLLVDFPFTDEASRAHAIAFALLPLVRPIISGNTPLHVFVAPDHGTGKTFLTQMLLMASTGQKLEPLTLPDDEDERRKQITSTLLRSPTAVLLDNVGRRVDSPALASVLTSPTWTSRILGQSRDVTLPVSCAWALTASNPDLTPELTRRSIEIHIDARMERPWERQNFKHNPLELWIEENQAALIGAFMTIVQHWLFEGQPRSTSKVLGSYFSWSAILGGILDAAGIPGFLGNLKATYERIDSESNDWRGFVIAWWETFGDRLVTSNELRDLADRQGLIASTLGAGNERSQVIRIGKALLGKQDRIVAGFRIQRERDRYREINLFCLVRHVTEITNSDAADGADPAADRGIVTL